MNLKEKRSRDLGYGSRPQGLVKTYRVVRRARTQLNPLSLRARRLLSMLNMLEKLTLLDEFLADILPRGRP